MAIPRKDALTRLCGLWPRVQQHLAKLTADPDARDAEHWRTEASAWLRQMEEVLPHVGKKTAAQWQARIEPVKAALHG